jgi:protein-tyrosine phosphatase
VGRDTDALVEILIVCMGNICRSPLAQAILQEEAGRRAGPEAPVSVRSAGVRGLDGRPATTEMRDEAARLGLDLSDHRGAAVDAALVGGADLILAMTEAQRDTLVRLAPGASERTFTLKELARLLRHVGPPEVDTVRERVAEVTRRAHRVRPRVAGPPDREDVADPYGANREFYRRTADEISALVDAVAPHLFGGEDAHYPGDAPADHEDDSPAIHIRDP